MWDKLKYYVLLMRLHKPIGILLLLWPTLWALWLVGASWNIIAIFITGVVLMRSAGCIINDVVDKKWDGAVARTRERPLVTGKLSVREAFGLFAILLMLAFLLVLQLNTLTIALAFLGLIFAVIYPFLKRITHLPQVGLGIAFSWGIPMVFAAQLNTVPWDAWLLFAAAVLWPIIYDTFYAMTDKADDIKIGVKSTAIGWGNYDLFIIGFFQVAFLLLLIMVGLVFNLSHYYYMSLVLAGILFLYQQWLAKSRAPEKCFKAFLNNNWVGFIIFMGMVA